LHRDFTAYEQEKLVYQRLRERSLHRILGFHLPTLIRFDDALLGIEMTIVKPPFVLDFAGATLDAVPEFSEEILADWRASKEEQFSENWSRVSLVLDELARHGIHCLSEQYPNSVGLRINAVQKARFGNVTA
jgi:hypothetical protein